MSDMKITKTVWFSSGGGFAQRGPYATQQEAYENMRLTAAEREKQRQKHGTLSPYPFDILVWPEYITVDNSKG